MTNQINPRKLNGSKWTAVKPQNKEKHFMVSKVLFNEAGVVIRCQIEAVLTRRVRDIDWQELKNTSRWIAGWH